MAQFPTVPGLSSGAVQQGLSLGSQAVSSAAPPSNKTLSLIMVAEFGVMYAGLFILGHWLEKE